MGVRRKLTYAEISIGFSKVIEGRMRQFGDSDGRDRAEIEELQLRGKDGGNLKLETDWNIMQQFLVEVDDQLHGNNLNTHAQWVQLISQAARAGNEAAVEILLEAIPDRFIIGPQSQVTTSSATYDLSTYPKGVSILQLLLQELSFRAPSHRLNLGVLNPSGETPLGQLAHHGQYELCELLLEYGADPNLENAFGNSPLLLACSNGHDSTVRILVDSGADVNTKYKGGNTCLHVAARRGCENALRHLLGIELRAHNFFLSHSCPAHNVNEENARGETPMHFAAYTGSLKSIRYLVGRGASVNHCTSEGMSPLAYAALNGHHEAIQVLLFRRANLNDEFIEPLSQPGLLVKTDRFSSRTLEVAVLRRYVYVVSQLLGYGACPNWRCLRIAAGIGCDRIFKLVLKAYIISTDDPRDPITINSIIQSLAKNDTVRPALLRVYIHSPWKISLLLAHKCCKGYDSIVPNESGMCALSLAAANKNATVVKLLLNVLPPHHSLNPRTSEIITQCLSSAVHSGCDEILGAFVSAGSTSRHYADWAPCMALIAIDNGYSRVLSTLIALGLDRNLLNLRYALEGATRNGHADMLRRMSELGFPVASVAHEGSLLHVAAKAGEDAVVMAFVELGVDVNSPTGPNMWRPLQLAAQGGHLSTVKLLLELGAASEHRNAYGWTAEFLARIKCHNSLVEYFTSLHLDTPRDPDIENPYNGDKLSSDDPFTEIFEIMPIELIMEEPSVGLTPSEVKLLAQTEPAVDVYPGQIFEMYVQNVGPLPPVDVDVYPGTACELLA